MIEGSENAYNSIQEIRQRKMKLHGEIKTEEKVIRNLWNSVFHQKEKNALMTPTKRMSKIISTGAGVVDGAILALKLYNRFRR